MSNINKYKKYLSEIPEFIWSAEKIYNIEYNKEEISEEFHKISSYVTAPVVVSYTLFILKECMERNIKKIYFLARDGMILFNIAKLLCEKMNIDIECNYLYCSRASLRMPIYKFIGEEAFDILLMRGFNLNAYNILMRLNMSAEERNLVYSDIEFNMENEKNTFNRIEFDEFTSKLRESEMYRNIVFKKSQTAYNSAIPYFRQEGLLDSEEFAIADTGWTGSMQRSLGQLLSYHSGKKIKMTGFYFGMFAPPKSDEYGEYINWYFSDKSSMKLMTKFNNNLFECMCCADHGMTTGYKIENGRAVPVLNAVSEINCKLAKHQIKCAVEFAENISICYEMKNFNEEELHKMTEKLLIRLMYKPEHDEAMALSQFTFCDDVSECYFLKLADAEKEEELKNSLIIQRIKCRIKHEQRNDELFWSYGTLALSNISKKAWYRFNINLWDKARFIINK